MKMSDLKTPCCQADYYLKSRANFRCTKCDADVSMAVVLFAQMLIDSGEMGEDGEEIDEDKKRT